MYIISAYTKTNPMRLPSITLILLGSFLAFTSFTHPGPPAKSFHIIGKIIGRDTGSVIFWYGDSKHNGHADTSRLNNGHFSFFGTVDKAAEALLWTDLKNRDFDDPSVIRFILTPGRPRIIHVWNSDSSVVVGS
ncbi:MAG TPA: DUF4369 domain-containing protein [Puia sp.]|nr:DUF4369 domain-containing protein [Puia sp.]